MLLDTIDTNTGAQRFYKQIGFQYLGEVYGFEQTN